MCQTVFSPVIGHHLKCNMIFWGSSSTYQKLFSPCYLVIILYALSIDMVVISFKPFPLMCSVSGGSSGEHWRGKPLCRHHWASYGPGLPKSIINLCSNIPVFYHLDLHHLLPQLAENGSDWDSPILCNLLPQPQDLPRGEMRMPNIGIGSWNRSAHHDLEILISWRVRCRCSNY